MSGWDGAGNFVLPYSMVAEANAGVKILAAHQDTQWAAFQVGIQNCQTRDGQNSPSADINWAGHKLTGLGSPVAGTDAANKAYVDGSVVTEWVTETIASAWVSATSVKISGVDATARYHAGRRVKIVHNNGGTTSYGTVVSSVFAVDTTVTVTMDGAVALVSPTTVISYGLLSYLNPSFNSVGTIIQVQVPGSTAFGAGPLSIIVPWSVKVVDTLGEFNTATHIFAPKYAGIYFYTCVMEVSTNAAGQGVGLNVLGGTLPNVQNNVNPQSGLNVLLSLSGLALLTAGQNFSVHFGSTGGTANTMGVDAANLFITRVGPA